MDVAELFGIDHFTLRSLLVRREGLACRLRRPAVYVDPAALALEIPLDLDAAADRIGPHTRALIDGLPDEKAAVVLALLLKERKRRPPPPGEGVGDASS